MIYHHYTNENAYPKIFEDGFIRPFSTRSAIGEVPFLRATLPKSHKIKGAYTIRDDDLEKWNSDEFALNHFAQLKSQGKTLVKLTFEIEDEPNIEILEENILYHELLPLYDENKGLFSQIHKIPKSIYLYHKYINSRISINSYNDEYKLPVAFVKKKIKLKKKLLDLNFISIDNIKSL